MDQYNKYIILLFLMTENAQIQNQKNSILELENLISINPYAITKNFEVISIHLQNLHSLNYKFNELVSWKTLITQQFQKFKTNSEKNYIQIKNLLRNQSKRRQTVDNLHQSNSINKQTLQEIMQQKINNEIKALTPNLIKKQQLNLFKQQLKTSQDQFNNKIVSIQKYINQIKNENNEFEKCQTNQVTEIEILKSNYTNIKNQSQNVEKRLKALKQSVTKIESMQYTQQIFSLKAEIAKKNQLLSNTIRRKVQYQDLYKLQEMLIGMIQYVNDQSIKKLSNKLETKKALIYLEKRINRILLQLYGDQGDRNDPLFSGKSWCLSCHKNNQKSIKNTGNNLNKTISKDIQKQNKDLPIRPMSPNIKFSNNQIKNSQQGLTKQPIKIQKDMISNIETNFMTFYGNSMEQKIKMHFEYMTLFQGGIKQYTKLQKKS